jgi:hypothetical protein
MVALIIFTHTGLRSKDWVPPSFTIVNVHDLQGLPSTVLRLYFARSPEDRIPFAALSSPKFSIAETCKLEHWGYPNQPE